LRALLLRECAVAAGAVVVRRDALMSVGLFDQSLAQGHEDDLWLRLVHGGHELHRCNLALATPRAVPADPIAECDRELDVLYKASRTLRLDRDVRLALRERASLVIRRRDLACARQLVARGDFDAARHHLHAIWPASVKVRVLRTALAFAPRLLRAVHIPQLFLTSDS
jgi:hypothetical protein